MPLSGGREQNIVRAQYLVNAQVVISDNELRYFDNSEVWLLRSENFYKINSSDIAFMAISGLLFTVMSDLKVRIGYLL